MLKKASLLIITFLLIVSGLYLYAVYQNNRDVVLPQTVELQQGLDQSIHWLENNQHKVLSQTNPMLWWMLYEAQKISPDARLEKLLEKYFQRNKRIKQSTWGPLFDGEQYRSLGAYAVSELPYYNQHFIYALNCAAAIAKELRLVARQNEASFCFQSDYIYRPACLTHQLMGVNFLATKRCDLITDIDVLSQSLQGGIVKQLTWDIRVVDVYLQRVMMLLISGAEDRVKPVWIQQVLNQQLNDGGWGNFDAILQLGDHRSLGFASHGVSIGEESSTFHATAQGMYILAYLVSREKSTESGQSIEKLNNT